MIISLLIGWISANATSKTNFVRTVDVLLYGPYLIYIGSLLPLIHRYVLTFIGATTITYNLRNLIGTWD